MVYFVYILKTGRGTLYTGQTNNLAKRLKAHLSGRGAKYTRSFGPVKLVYQEKLPDLSHALKREFEIKKMTRKEKLVLIRS